jgi:segregation and condensation protein B
MARLEAALLVAGSPLSARKLADAAMLPDVAEVQALIDRLNRAYDQARTPFRAERVAAGYRLMTRPRFAPWLDRLHQRPARIKLSLPALETLTVVALKQPITRADLEAIRGVQSTEILKQLMDRGLVKIVGEEDSLGRPYLYGTTALFLEQFGLRSLAELPAPERLTPQESLTSRPGLLASPAPSAGEEDTRAGGGEPSFSTDRAA